MSRTWILLAVIVAAGLGVRLSYLASDPHDPKSTMMDGELARSILAGHGLTMNERAVIYVSDIGIREHRLIDPATVDYTTVDRHGDWQPEILEPVGEGVLLAGVWELAGREYYLPMQILQAVVDSLCALLVFAISTRLFRRRTAALIAAALYAAYPSIAWQTTVVFNDIWAVDLTLAIVASYLEAIDSEHQWRWLCVCGLLTGAGLYFRTNLLVLPAVLALATIFGVGRRRTLLRALVPTAIALVALVPWTIHNYEEFHTLTLGRSGFGSTLWEGLGELPNNFGAGKDYFTYGRIHSQRPDLRPFTPAWDNFLLEHWVIPGIEHHPFFYVETVGYRIVRSTLLDYEGAWMHGVTLPRGRSLGAFASFAASHRLALLEDAFQPLVFLLAMLTLGLTWRRWRRQHIFLLALLISVLAPYDLIHLEPRYVQPAACAYLVWIGLGADLLLERARGALRTRRTRLLVDGAA